MRYRAQAILALLLLWAGTCAFGQDMKVFGTLGKLEPVASWDGKSDKPMVLVYKNRGVVFEVYGRGIMVASVFAPASSRSISSGSLGENDLVPGIGARGVMLGATRDQVKQSPFIIGARLEADQADGAMYRRDRNEILLVRVTGDRVSQLDVMGKFRTPEGVTNRSTIPDIERMYGRADQYYQVVNTRNPFSLLLIAPTILVFGLLTGLVIRAGLRDDASSPALIRAALIAAVALSVSFFLIGLMFVHLMGLSLDWKMLPVNMISSGLTGAICVLTMKILGSRVRDGVGFVITLSSMVLVSQAVAALTMGTGPVTFDASGMRIPNPNTLFVIGMFLTGRPKFRF